MNWKDIDSDVLEQIHFSTQESAETSSYSSGITSTTTSDFEMFIPMLSSIKPGDVVFFKIEKRIGQHPYKTPPPHGKTSLKIQGVNENNEITFEYSEESKNLTQSFSINLMTYQQ